MELLKSATTTQQQQPGSAGAEPARTSSGDGKASAAAPGRQGDTVSVELDAVPPPAPVGDDTVEQRPSAQLNAERMRELTRSLNRELEFRVAEDGRSIIDVVDTQTGEVIRTIPPDDQQRLIDALLEGDASLLLDGAA